MNRILISLFFGLSILFVSIAGPQSEQDVSGSLIEQKINELIIKMTLEEKLGQLNQLSGSGEWNNERTEAQISPEQADLVRKGKVGSFLNVIGAESTRKTQKIAVEESRLKIPLLFAYDVIHGYRTIFPIPLAEASTWDPQLVKQAARIAAKEAASAGLHWTFAPMVDVARDPRWGRIMEGSGEDPYLGSLLAAARVKGFQGDEFTNETLLACAKHYAAYGAAEAGRDYNTVDISERTLREIYLPPFKAAVDAGVATLMSGFNEISGVPSTANKMLLTDVLRKEWGFSGFVVSDWTSIGELLMHGSAATRVDAGIASLHAGVDMDMVSQIYVDDLPEAVRAKRITESIVDDAVRRVLRAKFKLGLFDHPYKYSDSQRQKQSILHPDHRAFARTVAQKSIVLLKNEKNILPLSKSTRMIAVLGPLADTKEEMLGSWSAIGKPQDAITVLQGIRTKIPADTKILYSKGCEIMADCGSALKEAEQYAAQADVSIVVVGEAAAMSGEANSRSNLDLPGNQEELVRTILKVGKPMVVVLMNGRPLTIPWISENVPAVLETWFLGIEAGNAMADVLFGDVNPSGKLPVTFPRNVGQVPIYYNHKNTGRPPGQEKWTSKYMDVADTPLYPFGFGLSYTTFKYDRLQINPEQIGMDGTLTITVELKNTGSRSGEEIVQLYVRDKVGSVTRPVKELKGFQKIALEPRESKTVTFTLKTDQLAFYNLEMKKVVEPGTFTVFVGGNSRDVLSADFEVRAEHFRSGTIGPLRN